MTVVRARRYRARASKPARTSSPNNGRAWCEVRPAAAAAPEHTVSPAVRSTMADNSRNAGAESPASSAARCCRQCAQQGAWVAD
ncbi:hypothetical protein ACFQ0M_48165 [Kitasatospora aburaviensis]